LLEDKQSGKESFLLTNQFN